MYIRRILDEEKKKEKENDRICGNTPFLYTRSRFMADIVCDQANLEIHFYNSTRMFW